MNMASCLATTASLGHPEVQSEPATPIAWITIGRVAPQHHYVSRFHLNQFLDPDSLSTQDPWLWQGFIGSGEVRRRSPKNLAKKPSMFDGPGCLVDRNATVEEFLANEIEAPAARVMKELCSKPSPIVNGLPQALTRYLAWAAARSLPMQTLENSWGQSGFGAPSEIVEPPPDGIVGATELKRDVQMLHPVLGSRVFQADSDFNTLFREGWYPDMNEKSNFLESVHMQAYYFQARFFPRFKWFALYAPAEENFIIADRPVGWVADGLVNEPPSCLRHPSAFLLAPICRTLVLVGRHSSEPWVVTPSQINRLMASWAHDWIAGPTQETVQSALDGSGGPLKSSGFLQ